MELLHPGDGPADSSEHRSVQYPAPVGEAGVAKVPEPEHGGREAGEPLVAHRRAQPSLVARVMVAPVETTETSRVV